MNQTSFARELRDLERQGLDIFKFCSWLRSKDQEIDTWPHEYLDTYFVETMRDLDCPNLRMMGPSFLKAAGILENHIEEILDVYNEGRVFDQDGWHQSQDPVDWISDYFVSEAKGRLSEGPNPSRIHAAGSENQPVAWENCIDEFEVLNR